MIQFRCPCGEVLSASEQDAGAVVACPKCATKLRVPGSAPPTQEAIQPPPAPLPVPPPVQPYAGEITPNIPPPAAVREAPWRGPQHPPRRAQTGGTSGKATVSLVLGLMSPCLPVLLSIPAIVFGIIGLIEARQGKRGKGLAIAGLVSGGLSLVICPFAYSYVFFYSFQRIRDAAARMESLNNLKQIGLAMHAYSDAKKKLPSHAIYKDGKPLLSWRVALLEHMGPEEKALFLQFNLNEPWDSPHNIKLLSRMPKVYAHPSSQEPITKGLTHYQVFVGDGTPFPKDPNRKITLTQIGGADGGSITIFATEAANAVPWTAPEDMPFASNAPLPRLGLNDDHFNILLGDGFVVTYPRQRLDEQNLRNLITWADGQVVKLP